MSSLVDGVSPTDLLIRFTILPINNNSKSSVNSYNVSGWIIVSPESGWVIREYGKVINDGSGPGITRIGRIEYAQSAENHLDPVRLTEGTYLGRVDRNPNTLPASQFDLTFDLVDYHALPEADFRLPAFGLPEVTTSKVNSPLKSYEMFALSLVGFAVAAGLKYVSFIIKRN